MILRPIGRETPIQLSTEAPSTLIFKETMDLYQFQNDIKNLCSGEDGISVLFGEEKPISFEKEVEVISDVLSIDINTRKTINYLHKQLIKDTARSDHIVIVENIKEQLIELFELIRKETFIDFSIDPDVGIDKFFKMYDVRFTESNQSPVELLTKYIDLLRQVSKVRVVFVTLAWYWLNDFEIREFIKHCVRNEIFLVLIEKDIPKLENDEDYAMIKMDLVV